MTNGLSHSYQLDESTFILGASGVIFHFYFTFRLNSCKTNRIAPDGTPLGFYGLTEAPKGEPDNTESKLKDFLKHELSFDNPETVNNIVFDRVPRLERPKRDQSSYPRPIVAKFERYRDRELVRNAGRELNDKNNGYNLREQFPPEIEARRKLLYPVMRSYQRDPKNRIALVRDKLYINGTLYESNITNNSDISQSRQQYGAEPLKSSARNRRFVRGVRLVERHPIETHNPFDATTIHRV